MSTLLLKLTHYHLVFPLVNDPVDIVYCNGLLYFRLGGGLHGTDDFPQVSEVQFGRTGAPV